MAATINIEFLKNLFTSGQTNDWYVPGLATLASLLTAVALLSLLPSLTVTSWAITTDTAPLAAAGSMPQPVVGYLQFSAVRVYIPLFSILLVVGAELAGISLGRLGMVIAVVLGVIAGSQLIVLTGCGCAHGPVDNTLSLFEQAARLI